MGEQHGSHLCLFCCLGRSTVPQAAASCNERRYLHGTLGGCGATRWRAGRRTMTVHNACAGHGAECLQARRRGDRCQICAEARRPWPMDAGRRGRRRLQLHLSPRDVAVLQKRRRWTACKQRGCGADLRRQWRCAQHEAAGAFRRWRCSAWQRQASPCQLKRSHCHVQKLRLPDKLSK